MAIILAEDNNGNWLSSSILVNAWGMPMEQANSMILTEKAIPRIPKKVSTVNLLEANSWIFWRVFARDAKLVTLHSSSFFLHSLRKNNPPRIDTSPTIGVMTESNFTKSHV